MSAQGAMKKPPATYADIEALPEHKLGEIIGDDLIISPRSGGPHAFATTSLVGEIDGPFQKGRNGPGGWLILFGPELHFDGQVLVPDIAGWRSGRAPSAASVFFTDAPDWICETLSPSTAVLDRTRGCLRRAACPLRLARRPAHTDARGPAQRGRRLDRGREPWRFGQGSRRSLRRDRDRLGLFVDRQPMSHV